ncbi:hypothetical protein [Qiania dongpingensis]|uniref:Uncharacterized protein n=1 Tax=Qiania dongpingensis TaxID=2763669 RepID=A0A7G9G631_9FIRM|nr:hypothetical protein [Qiania dongpingensis]QNM06263.1 hypothetical protein H9Q78_03705 [Qiania dongpingensis]
MLAVKTIGAVHRGPLLYARGPYGRPILFGIEKLELIQNSAAGRAPAERVWAGLKVNDAGQRPVFLGRREAETEIPIPFLSEPETGNRPDFLPTCERYCRSGDKAAHCIASEPKS